MTLLKESQLNNLTNTMPACLLTGATNRRDASIQPLVVTWKLLLNGKCLTFSIRCRRPLPAYTTCLHGFSGWTRAPAFCKPIARLFNKSIAISVVPLQWKRAYICTVPKNTTPTDHSDFRPISITPVLCRTLERVVVKRFLCSVPSASHTSKATILPLALEWVMTRYLTPDIMVKYRKSK